MAKNIREFTPEEKIQRAYDMIQIKNVMARHAFYHAANRHDIEMETLWAHKAPNVSWGNSGGFQIGRDVVWSFYAAPHVGHGMKPGETQVHTLTTPLIEIAGDGQTAQAMWYTPGYICGHGGPMDPDDAPLDGQWMYERYAIDFIKEDLAFLRGNRLQLAGWTALLGAGAWAHAGAPVSVRGHADSGPLYVQIRLEQLPAFSGSL